MDDCPQANRRRPTMGGGNRSCGKSTMYVLGCLPPCVMPLSVYHLSFITSAHFSHAVGVCVCIRISVCTTVCFGFCTERGSPFHDRIMLNQRWQGRSRRRCSPSPEARCAIVKIGLCSRFLFPHSVVLASNLAGCSCQALGATHSERSGCTIARLGLEPDESVWWPRRTTTADAD